MEIFVFNNFGSDKVIFGNFWFFDIFFVVFILVKEGGLMLMVVLFDGFGLVSLLGC